MQIDRAFVRVAEGLVHYRQCGPQGETARLPLYMIHASPLSAVTLEPLMGVLGASRRVIAPDTLGYGDSAPPGVADPEIEDFADSVARVLDALGLSQVDVYGSHTGAHIACELALRHPARVRRVVFDGIGMFTPEDKRDFAVHYAPAVQPDAFGRHLLWAWNWTRDGMLYFPHFRQTPAHRRAAPMPDAAALHAMTTDLLKAVTTYHLGYRAAFRHPDRARLPLLTQPVFCTASEDDILVDAVPVAAACIPNGTSAVLPSERTPEGLAVKARAIASFLDG